MITSISTLLSRLIGSFGDNPVRMILTVLHRLLRGRDGDRLEAERGNGATATKDRALPAAGGREQGRSRAPAGQTEAAALGRGCVDRPSAAGPRRLRRARRSPLRPRRLRSDARRGISPYLDPAEEAGLVLLAPDSRDRRDWDIFFPSHYGPDVRFINRALEHTFDRLAADPGRLTVMGFSDGATYALSLGLATGTCSRTWWRSRRVLWRRRAVGASRPSSSCTVRTTRYSGSGRRAAGSCRV
jgi:hypothetical protein